MTKLEQSLRWIAVLPGAILGAIIVMFPVHWVAMYLHHFGTPDPMITDERGRSLFESMPLESLERFGYALFVAGTLVGVGAFIAPRFHFVTAVILTSILVGIMSCVFLSAHSTGMHFDDSVFRLVMTFVLWLISVAAALSYARGLDKRA